MGEAMIQGLVTKHLIDPAKITVCEPRVERREQLKQQHKIKVTSENRDAIRSSIIVLSIKPQDLSRVLKELKGRLKPDQLVVSIVAGARIKTITDGLTHTAVVRVMPNTPMLQSKGSLLAANAPICSRSSKMGASALR